MEDCINKEVTAILRHLSALRLQETSEYHQLPAQNRATSNQSRVRPTAFHPLDCPLIQPIQFGYQGIKGDLVSKYSTSSVVPLSTQPVLSSLKAIRLVRYDLPLVNSGCLQGNFCPLCGQSQLTGSFAHRLARNMVRLTSLQLSVNLFSNMGASFGDFLGLSITSCNGRDLLKLMKTSSVSTLTGISIHASTLYASPFGSWAAEGPCSCRLSWLSCLLYTLDIAIHCSCA